jgi:hypothetical protein
MLLGMPGIVVRIISPVYSMFNAPRFDALFDNPREEDLLLLACMSRFIRLFVFFRGVPSLFMLEGGGDVLSLSRLKLRTDFCFDDDPLDEADLEKSVGSDNPEEVSLVEPELPPGTRTDCDLANLSRDKLRLGELPLDIRTDCDLANLSRDLLRFGDSPVECLS